MLYIALPIHWNEVGLLSLVEVGLLLAVNRFIRLPLNPLISWLYSKMSIRTGLFAALLIAGSTTLLHGWAQGFVFWLILRCIWGIAWSFIRIGAYFTIVEVSTADNRGQNMGAFNGLSRIGSLVGMLGGGFLVDWFGFRDVSLGFGLLAFLSLPLISRLPQAISNKRNQEPALGLSFLRNKPLLLKSLVTVFLIMLSLEGMVSATLSHLINVREITIDLEVLILSAAILASLIQALRLVIGVFLSPWIGKKSDGRWGRRPILIVTLLLATVFMFLSQVQFPTYLWLLNMIALLLASSVLIVLLDAFVTDQAEERSRSKTITSYVMISDIGAAFGPVLGYLSVKSFGLTATYWIAAFVLFLLTIQWVTVRGTSKTFNSIS